MADPTLAMRETIAIALGCAGASDTVVRCEVVDLDVVARAVWKQAFAELDERVRVARNDEAASFLDDASIEIIGE